MPLQGGQKKGGKRVNAEQARAHMAEQPAHTMIIQGDQSLCWTCDEALPPEQATVTVKVSSELITQLSTWSEPVQVMITRDENGAYDMIARRPESEAGE